MDACIILADAVSAHPDGTFSMLRGGISENIVPPGQPARFQGALLARVRGERGEPANHSFAIRCVDEDGNTVMPEMSGNFAFPAKGGSVHIALNFHVIFPKAGKYQFSLVVDNQGLAYCSFESKVKSPSAEQRAGS